MDAGGPWTGASINPARVFAGLIVYGCNLHGVWWIYLLSQVVGAFLGAGVRSFFKIVRRMLMPEPSSYVDCCSGCLRHQLVIVHSYKSAFTGQFIGT